MKWTALAILMAACGGSGSNNNGTMIDIDAPVGNPTADAPTNPPDPDGSVAHHTLTVFTILLENHDYAEIIGSANAPYVNSLLAQGALATNYKDTNHPSLPNYLHMISGADQYPGIIDVDPTTGPYFPANKPNLGTQFQAAGIKWRAYDESMGTPCKLAGAGTYAPKHDPFLYFVDQQMGANNLCATTNVDYSNFEADLATNTYRFMWITPNLTDDGHDPANNPTMALKTSDTWLSVQVPKILASQAFQDGGVLFITWDEAEGRNGDDKDKIPMIILSPRIKTAGMTSSAAYTHSSYTATIEDLFGLPRLATVTSSPAMMEFLNPP